MTKDSDEKSAYDRAVDQMNEEFLIGEEDNLLEFSAEGAEIGEKITKIATYEQVKEDGLAVAIG